MLADNVTKPKMEDLDCLVENGEKISENVETLKNVANAQKTLIDQQKALIDWLTDFSTAQKSAQKLPKRFRYVFIFSTVILLLTLLSISLIVFRKSLFSRIVVFPPINNQTDKYISGHPVYSRSNWGALDEKESPPLIPLPTSLVIISHSATKSCSNFTECAKRVQDIQLNGFLEKGHRDIGYNFLIGGEGGIYVGREWDLQNSMRAKSVALAFIGDFNREHATKEAEDAAHRLIAEGVRMGKVDSEYKLIGENQTSALRYYSPGLNLVSLIKGWEHYFPGTML